MRTRIIKETVPKASRPQNTLNRIWFYFLALHGYRFKASDNCLKTFFLGNLTSSGSNNTSEWGEIICYFDHRLEVYLIQEMVDFISVFSGDLYCFNTCVICIIISLFHPFNVGVPLDCLQQREDILDA